MNIFKRKIKQKHLEQFELKIAELVETELPELKKAIGISVEDVITSKSGLIEAIGQSFKLTGFFIIETFNGLWGLLTDALTGKGSLDGVSGPVGIVGIVGPNGAGKSAKGSDP